MQVEYNVKGGKPVIQVFPWGPRKWELMKTEGVPYYPVRNFEPYFYLVDGEVIPKGVVRAEDGGVSIGGVKVKKCYVTIPKEVPVLREGLRHLEADVQFPQRYVIDRVPEIPHVKPDVMYLDLEMAASHGLPDPLNPVDPITCIWTYNSAFRAFYGVSWHPSFDEGSLIKTRGSTLVRFQSERALLNAFASLLRNTVPDVWAGWNLINFDARCLFGRFAACGLRPDALSPLREAWITKKEGDPVFKGVVLFDLLAAYKDFKNRDFESLSLEATAQRELGVGKRPIDKSRITQIWQETPEVVEDYCRTDVELLVRIDRKLQLIDFYTDVHEFTGAFLGSLIDWKKKKLHGGHVVETFFMRNSDYVLPSHIHGRPAPALKGADTLDPKRGLHRGIVMIDDPSKYPSLMATFNMSIDSLVAGEPDATDHGPIRVDFASFERHEEHLGEVPRLVELLFQKKDAFHELRNREKPGSDEWKMYDRRRYAYKRILNSFQGVSSQPSSRLYHPAIAHDITWAGREMLHIAERTVKEFGHEVIFGHTDSIYFTLSAPLKEQVEVGTAVAEAVTQNYRKWADQKGVSGPWIRLRSELEGVADAGFFHAKTMYALKMKWKGDAETGQETDEVEIAGFQSQRSDWPLIARELVGLALRRLLDGVHPSLIEQEIAPRLQAIHRGEVAPELVAIPKGLGKAIGSYRNHSPWDKGAQWSNKNLETVRFAQGSKPRLLYVKKVPANLDPTDVICIDDGRDIPEGVQVDWPLMAEKTRMAFSGIISALGLNEKTFLTPQKALEVFS
jgi:DNA polymerase elongation subunit (family B)